MSRISIAFAAALLGSFGCAAGDPDSDRVVRETSELAAACVEQALTPASASASSQENAGSAASKAIDGSTTTRWSSQFSDPQWLSIDLGARRKVSRVRLDWESAAAKDYQLQISDDGLAFTTLTSRAGLPSANHRIDDLTALNGAGRYVRVYATARATAYGDSIYEAQIFGDPDPSCGGTTGATCSDGVKNGTEGDVDCGGTCTTLCGIGKTCNKPSDCVTNLCSRFCLFGPTCSDGVMNGSETDIDCGGSCANKCPVAAGCATNSDCSSNLCTAGVCRTLPTCSDQIMNGSETGIDCGGSCAACPVTGGSCQSGALTRVAASATSQENGTLGAAKAIDGSLTTRWSSAFSDPQSITVDLGARRFVSRVLLNWQNAASANYSLQISDSATGPWTPLYGPVVGNGGDDDIPVSGKGRYVRMTSTARTGPYGNSLWEFQIFGDANPDCGSSGADSDGDRLSDADELTRGTNPNDPDTDDDGLPDGDEVLGTTGFLNLPAMGTNPRHKDILIELDWFGDSVGCALHTHRPTAAIAQKYAQAFAAGPVSNPDGVSGVHVITDFGQGGVFVGGNRINDADGIIDAVGPEFTAYKAANFAANRQGYFHYAIVAHQYTDTSNQSTGAAVLGGSDLIITLQCQTDTNAIANTIMHELGHNLSLQHGGDVTTNYKPNYNSIMNYRFQFTGIDTNCDKQGDGVASFSTGSRAALNESSLDERVGVCGGVAIDWNRSGAIDTARVAYDINDNGDVFNPVGDGKLEVLTDYDDWAHLAYDFAPSVGFAKQSAPREIIVDTPPMSAPAANSP